MHFLILKVENLVQFLFITSIINFTFSSYLQHSIIFVQRHIKKEIYLNCFTLIFKLQHPWTLQLFIFHTNLSYSITHLSKPFIIGKSQAQFQIFMTLFYKFNSQIL
ncbi:unnamed protein product (macronuclear) [Paramecium tetraurelia]|uniref:Transmembrane protein n=1 Tax=Paramecium tetraurelia TaxID=5888 RepID=A0DMX7_PARTE|nr:uncharacterized protein GSPATT00018599001 [Paramecium tetraurelia]CAK84394.1 unnamed protein product [Paramecium tetraurelia]|eukprot:XP_001451791.1 hypothetical protein (macronuclear) [Paramecium tetraurelia strain d4-2]